MCRPHLVRRQSTSSAVRAHSSLHEVAQLALGEAGAEVLAELAVAEHFGSARAVAPEHARARLGDGMRAIAAEDLARARVSRLAKSLPGSAARAGPGALQPGKKGRSFSIACSARRR